MMMFEEREGETRARRRGLECDMEWERDRQVKHGDGGFEWVLRERAKEIQRERESLGDTVKQRRREREREPQTDTERDNEGQRGEISRTE